MSKLDLKHLTTEDRDKLKQLVESIKEIKKEIAKMINPPINKENSVGGNKSTGQHYNI